MTAANQDVPEFTEQDRKEFHRLEARINNALEEFPGAKIRVVLPENFQTRVLSTLVGVYERGGWNVTYYCDTTPHCFLEFQNKNPWRIYWE